MPARPTVVWMPGAVRTEIHLTGQDTGGAFCLMVDDPPPGWSLPAHRHLAAAETIHILAGEFEMSIDGERTALAAGETVHVPAGSIHSGGNLGPVTGRRLVIFSPAGMERFFLEVGAAGPAELMDMPAALAAAIRHGWEFTARGT